MRFPFSVVVATASLVVATISTPVATADVVDISCSLGTQVGTYSPGLTLTDQEVRFTATGTLAACVSPAHPDLTGATFTASGTGTLSCLAGSTPNTTVYHWNNGAKSTVAGTGAINLKPAGTTVLVLTGEVTAGLFAGATVVQTKVLPATDVTGCLSPEGLTSVSGPVSLTVSG